MNTKIEQFKGRWKVAGGQIGIVFDIKPFGKSFRIKAHDESDGEKLLISKIKWDGKTLSFETLTPSTKWRTKNRLTCISEKEITHELTHWEKWERVHASTPQDMKMLTAQGAISGTRRASKAVTPSTFSSARKARSVR
jgi:hypothetical protein